MFGVAERNINSTSHEIVSSFKIGETYSVERIEEVLGYKPGGADRKGVLGGEKTDYLVLKITFEKVTEMNDDYQDHIFGSTLFWSSQRNRRFAERCACDKKHDVFVFVRVKFGDDFLYYGRAIPIRMWNSTEKGKPSNIVFDLPEYAESLWFKNSEESKFVYNKDLFRRKSLELWNNHAAVGKVDDSNLLITRHIKPIKESTEKELNDPLNSLVLTPNIDNLFARGIISFSDTNGKIILPKQLDERIALEKMNVCSSLALNDIPNGTEPYLRYHKTYIWGFYCCNDEWKYK